MFDEGVELPGSIRSPSVSSGFSGSFELMKCRSRERYPKLPVFKPLESPSTLPGGNWRSKMKLKRSVSTGTPIFFDQDHLPRNYSLISNPITLTFPDDKYEKAFTRKHYWDHFAGRISLVFIVGGIYFLLQSAVSFLTYTAGSGAEKVSSGILAVLYLVTALQTGACGIVAMSKPRSVEPSPSREGEDPCLVSIPQRWKTRYYLFTCLVIVVLCLTADLASYITDGVPGTTTMIHLIIVFIVTRTLWKHLLPLLILSSFGFIISTSACGIIIKDESMFGLAWWASMISFLLFMALAAWTCRKREVLLRIQRQLQRDYKAKQKFTDRLICKILPSYIVNQVKKGSRHVALRFEEATVLFFQLSDYAKLTVEMDGPEMLQCLHVLYSDLDMLVESFGCYKVIAVGGTYMVASGVPETDPHHLQRIANLALSFLHTSFDYGVNVTIGISSGPTCAGLIGEKLFAGSFSVYGDHINIAHRIMMTGKPNTITVTDALAHRLKEYNFLLEDRGEIFIRGRSDLRLWYLLKTNSPIDIQTPHLRIQDTTPPPPPTPEDTLHIQLHKFSKTFKDSDKESAFRVENYQPFVKDFRIVAIFLFSAAITLIGPTLIATGIEHLGSVRNLSLLISLILAFLGTILVVLLPLANWRHFQFHYPRWLIFVHFLWILVSLGVRVGEKIPPSLPIIFLFLVLILFHFVHGQFVVTPTAMDLVMNVVWTLLSVFVATDPIHALYATIPGIFLLLLLTSFSTFNDCKMSRMSLELHASIKGETEKSQEVLKEILPERAITALTLDSHVGYHSFGCISVVVADIAGFTRMSSNMTANEMVEMLNAIYGEFDHLIQESGMFKMEIVGDSYIACAGLEADFGGENHAELSVSVAQQMAHVLDSEIPLPGKRVTMRIGIHSGSAVGGVVGQNKLRYHLWGRTMTIGGAVEANGIPNEVVITESTLDLLNDRSDWKLHKNLSLQEIGEIKTYRKEDDSPELNAFL